ncbi:LysR family transcriptional regulator, partial [Mesorhizobium sp. M7A.F.Ca.AU.002.02.1.1]
MRIPSTQALRALDSFARHGSVWRAADELHLTRSAVSHQLRLLERDLGFDLLERIGKGVALTPRGQRYASDVRKALT